MWLFNNNQTTKKVNGELYEDELSMQDKMSLYSGSKKIINGKSFVQIYVDEREVEKTMELNR